MDKEGEPKSPLRVVRTEDWQELAFDFENLAKTARGKYLEDEILARGFDEIAKGIREEYGGNSSRKAKQESS